jgi:indolepyruvate ferredoxin oxidoreductase
MCPSFVSVVGGTLRKREGAEAGQESAWAAALPAPALPAPDGGFSLLIAGIGGNGVVTMGALLGMAAHLEDKACTVLDISGLAQRNGPVTSHVRFAGTADAGGADGRLAPRIPTSAADVVIGCDPVVSTMPDTLARMAGGRTAVVFNRFVAPTNAFATNPDLDFGAAAMEAQLAGRADPARLFGLDATDVATRLLGDAIGANLMLVGYAWQKGLIPLTRDSIETAIRLNGSAVALNLRAFTLGRIAAVHPERLAAPVAAPAPAEMPLEALIADRVQRLTAYQDAAYAARYRALVERVRAAEAPLGSDALARTVARVYARLLAYKDEYEVARLYADPAFRRRLADTFDGDVTLKFHLAPPLLSRRDPATGRYRKRAFGGWMLGVFGLLARLKGLRGTPLDPFGHSAHRRMERRLIGEYEALVDGLLAGLDRAGLARAVALAGLADKVRGFDVVKEQAVAEMATRRAALEAEPLRAAAE